MNPKEYVKHAVVTESNNYAEIGGRLAETQSIRLLHAAIGLCTEAGEIQDALKKSLFYGKPLDTVNLKEEIGDIMWYVALACDALGADLGEIMGTNIAKLKARFGDKFTAHAALNRDLETERKILESDDNTPAGRVQKALETAVSSFVGKRAQDITPQNITQEVKFYVNRVFHQLGDLNAQFPTVSVTINGYKVEVWLTDTFQDFYYSTGVI